MQLRRVLGVTAVVLAACGSVSSVDGGTGGGGGGSGGSGGGGSGGGSSGSVIAGCWVTHTNTGTTQLHLMQQGTTVTGDLSWSTFVYPVENGVLDANGLRFRINWASQSFSCDYDFTGVQATALSGVATCAGMMQNITADRTCP